MKTVKFKSKGLVLRKIDDLSNIESCKKFEADTLEDLISNVTNTLKDDNITVLGYTGAIGVILGITKQTTIEVDGDEYINEKLYLEFVGELTDEDREDLQKYYFKYLVD